MYLTAQRPNQAAGELLSINSYLYDHEINWQAAPPANLPDLVFVRGRENAPTPTRAAPRRIRSYLDIIAPDQGDLAELQRAIAHLHRFVTSAPGPWHHICGRCRVEFGLEAALANVWHTELHWLWGEAERLLLDPEYANVLP